MLKAGKENDLDLHLCLRFKINLSLRILLTCASAANKSKNHFHFKFTTIKCLHMLVNKAEDGGLSPVCSSRIRKLKNMWPGTTKNIRIRALRASHSVKQLVNHLKIPNLLPLLKKARGKLQNRLIVHELGRVPSEDVLWKKVERRLA